MKPRYVLLVLLAPPLGILFAIQSSVTPAVPSDMTCANEMLTSYSYTDKQFALAEMAGIVSWQDKAEEKNPGLGDWHLAKKRRMNCHPFRNSGHIQCVLSAIPCGMKKS